MLEALASDWSRLDGYEVHVAWDERLGSWSVPRTAVHTTNTSSSLIEAWTEILARVDAGVVIVPEIDGEFLTITSALRQRTSTPLFNVDAEYGKVASDKWLSAQWFRRANVAHPETRLLSDVVDNVAKLPYSVSGWWVIKPRDGAGCEGILRLASNGGTPHLTDLPLTVHQCSNNFVIQPWLHGQAGSVSMLIGSQEDYVFPPMTQKIDVASAESSLQRLVYSGGEGPWYPVSKHLFEAFARSVIRSLPGRPLGWLGIDFVVTSNALGESKLVAIEVNPRVTTSYLGIRQVVVQNLAGLWRDIQNGHAASYSLFSRNANFSPFGGGMIGELE